MDFKKVNLDFVPFGFASHKELPEGKNEWKCQHGEPECHGNRMLACAVHVLTPERSPVKPKPEDEFPGHLKEARPRGQNLLLQYMICVMSSGNP
ncbi:unnamed protein product, partial [Notodromas monacha]